MKQGTVAEFVLHADKMHLYRWSDASGAVTVELALDLVDRLAMESLEAYKAVPRGGLEVGGFLLGSREERSGSSLIRVDHSVPVPSEYRAGPSYALSASDLETLDEIFAGHPDAVGTYRTLTHAETLTLQPDDTSIFRRHFTSIASVFLLIHPASRTAAFCLLGPNGLAVAHEFPLDSGALVSGSVEAESAATVPPRRAVVFLPKSRRVRVWLLRGAALAAGGLLGAVVGHYANNTNRPVPVQVASPVHMALNVVRDGRSLRLSWNPDDSFVRTADHGTLQITDGTRQTNLHLTSTELSAGALVYWPDTQDVAFHMEVFHGSRRTDAEILAVAASPAAPGILPTPPAPATSAENTAHRWAAAASRTSSPSSETSRPPQAKVEDMRASNSKEGDSQPRGILSSVPPQTHAELAAVPAKPIDAEPTVTRPHVTEPRVEISAEPVPPSRWSRLVHHIPLMGRLKKQRHVIVPPEPVHEAKPPFTSAEQHALTAEVPVDVRVYITESGKVDYAEFAENSRWKEHPGLANAALYAARHWDFRPAREGDENVPSEEILHFRFQPPGSTQPRSDQ